MSRKTPVDSMKKILKVIAAYPEFKQSDLEAETKISYPTIIKTLRILEKNDFIKLVRTEPSSKGGKEKKIYKITYKGLVYVLIQIFALNKHEDKKEIKDLQKKVITAQAQEMLLFEKWPLFKKAGLENFMLENLKESFSCFTVSSALIAKQRGEPYVFDNHPITHDSLTGLILITPLMFRKASKEYIDFLKSDPELSKFVNNAMNNLKKEMATRQQTLELWGDSFG